MVLDELLALGGGELVQGVELAGKVTLVGLESLADTGHDLNALFVGDAWSEGIVGEVAANTNTGRVDHSGLILWEGWAVELRGVHVGDVLGVWAVLVVVLNDTVEELAELLVGVVGTGIGANARVNILAAREDACFEGDTLLVALVLVLVPDLLGEESADGGLLVLLRELGEVLEVVGVLKPWPAVGNALFSSWLNELWSVTALRSCTTHVLVFNLIIFPNKISDQI